MKGEQRSFKKHRAKKRTQRAAEDAEIARQARREALEEAELAVRKPVVRMPNEPWTEYLDRRRDAAIAAISALMEKED